MITRLLLILITLNSLDAVSLSELSLEEKVGQLLMPCFHGEEVNEDARVLIQEVKVGGIIYYTWANGLSSQGQVATLSSGLQHLAKIPLLIAIDEEGGLVSRLEACGGTVFSGNLALGMTKEPKLAKQCSFAIGNELQHVGINMNLAPVIDINSNPKNPIIGIRSFGDDPKTVTAFGKRALEGYKQASILTTLKHFPGHGEVNQDSHLDLPVNSKSKNELEQMELVPFKKLAVDADAIMTAHIITSAFDSEYCATFSKSTLDYLRNEIGFQGVIISDSLTMEGALKQTHGNEAEAAILALRAGCDILLFGGKQLENTKEITGLPVKSIKIIHQAIMEALINGRLSEERLNQAVERILHLKTKIQSGSYPLDRVENDKLAKTISNLALKVEERSLEDLRSLSNKSICLIAPATLKDELAKTSFSQTTILDEKCLEQADILIIFSCNAWKDPAQGIWIQRLMKTKKPIIGVVTRDPIDALLFSKAALLLTTYSPKAPSLQAAFDWLNLPHYKADQYLPKSANFSEGQGAIQK